MRQPLKYLNLFSQMQSYFSSNGRQLLYIQVGCRDRTKDFRDQVVEEGGRTGETEGGMVETCRLSRKTPLPDQFDYGTTLGPNRTGGQQRLGKRNRRDHVDLQAFTQQLLTYPTTPMMNIVRTIPWLEDDDFCYVREDDVRLKTAIDVLQSRVASWNYYDFRLLYKKHTTIPLWNSLTPDLSELYYDTQNSLTVLKEFLEFQFGDRDQIISFLQDVHNVCERRIPKLNTICIVSPPSGGKNFFFDMVLSFYWNKGQLGNPNKNNTFAYQEAVGKRILLWNEPNYESAETDMLKMVLGGDNYTVKVKYRHDCAVYRTPVIVLSNTVVPFMHDSAFADRIRVFYWQTCPLLKERQSKPLPSAWIDLLEHYDIE